MRDCFVIAGQSNAQGYGVMATLRLAGLSTNPGSPGAAPDYVPAADQTAANEWAGAPHASLDTAVEYAYPDAAAYPCLYVENATGTAGGIQDGWGGFVKQQPSGSVVTSFGPELSFLARHLTVYPSTPLACVKQVLGGSSLAGDWLPNTVAVGTAQAGSSTTITLASGEFRDPTGLVIRVASGAGAGSTGTCTAYDSGSKVATVPSWSGAAPGAGSTYGIERLQSQVLRTMLAQAAARLDASEGAGNWRWAGLLWWQGESGAHSAGTAADDSQYLSDARALFAWVRTLTRSDLPVVVVRIHDAWGWESAPNPYLEAAGYPYAAIDASYWFGHSPFDGDGTRAAPAQDRSDYLAGAAARRATLVALGSDPHCAWAGADGLPPRPPYGVTAAPNDITAYHLGSAGQLTVGERAFNAYRSLVSPRRTRLRAGGGRAKLRASGVRL